MSRISKDLGVFAGTKSLDKETLLRKLQTRLGQTQNTRKIRKLVLLQKYEVVYMLKS